MENPVIYKLLSIDNGYHSGVKINFGKFTEVLRPVQLGGSGYSRKVANVRQKIEDGDRTHYFSLRRVIVRDNIGKRDETIIDNTSWFNRLCKAAIPGFRRHNLYSSDVMVESALQDQDILKLIRESECSAALLGKLESIYSFSSKKEYVLRTPQLFIYGTKQSGKIVEWESDNAVPATRIIKRGKKVEHKADLEECLKYC